MTPNTGTYYTLLASLPTMPADYRQPHVPISRPRLEDRLAMLDEENRLLVDLLFALMAFDTSAAAQCDPEKRALHERLIAAMPDQATREPVELWIDAMDIAAAHRARQQKKEPPAMLGSYADHIKRHWQHPQFNLGLRCSWIAKVGQRLENAQIVQAEDAVYQAIWQQLRRYGERHYFSLPALVTYLIQWHLVSRWAVRDKKIGADRFTSLLHEAINGHDALFNTAAAS